MDSSPAGEMVFTPESVDASSISVLRSSSDIVVTEVAAAGTSLIESGLPATVAISPSQPSQSAVRKQTGEIPAVTERPSAIEEDLWRPTLDMESRPAIHALDLPVSLAPLPASADVHKHGPCGTMTDIDRQMPARPEPYYSLPASSDDSTRWPDAGSLMTDADRQSVVRPDVYSSLSTTSYEYSSLSVDSLLTSVARPKVSLDSHDVDACYGRPRGVEFDTSLASTESYQDVGAETVLRPVLPLRSCRMARSLLLLWIYPALLPDIHRRLSSA